MPKRCSICVHKKRKEIDAAILEGDDLRSLSLRFSVSAHSLSRHKRGGHIEAAIIRASQIQEIHLGDSLVEQLKALQQKALSLLTLAEDAGDYRTALAGVREARGSLEVLVEAMSKLRENPPIEQRFMTIGQDQVEGALQALLDSKVVAIEGEAGEVAAEREDSVTIETAEMDTDEKERSAEPPLQIG